VNSITNSTESNCFLLKIKNLLGFSVGGSGLRVGGGGGFRIVDGSSVGIGLIIGGLGLIGCPFSVL
jgi:hypothetical protein